jgi:hypothetical protein
MSAAAATYPTASGRSASNSGAHSHTSPGPMMAQMTTANTPSIRPRLRRANSRSVGAVVSTNRNMPPATSAALSRSMWAGYRAASARVTSRRRAPRRRPGC